MITYVRSFLASTFDHPVLASFYIIAAITALLGFAVDFLNVGSPVYQGFVGVYAIFFASIATIGYMLVYLVRLVSKARDRMGPTAS